MYICIPCTFTYVFLISIQRLYSKRNMVYGLYAKLTITSPYVDSKTCMYHGQPYARVDFIPQSGTKNLASDLVGVWFGSLASVATLDYCPRLAGEKSGEWTCKQPCTVGSDRCVVNRPLHYNEAV